MYQTSDYHAPIISSKLGKRPSFLRLVRWIAALLLSSLGLTLGATSLSGYRVVRDALDTVVQGQGEALLQVALRATHRGAVDASTLRGVLDIESVRGLRCVVLFEYGPPAPEQPVRVQPSAAAGHCLTPMSEWSGLVLHARSAPTPVGNRIRLMIAPPPGVPEARPLLLEFIPQMADALGRSAMRTLLSGGIAMLALLCAAVVFWRLSVREEHAAATRERRRQLASLGEMAAVLAHELRNPLAALKGHAQLLLEQLPQDSRPRAKAERVVSEAERLEALSEDLLSFVRTTVIEPQQVNPADLLAECVAAAADARIETDVASAPARWRLDPLRLQQVLGNLLRNALEASAADGKVQCSVRAEGDELMFRIRDHGKGLREEDLERIFEPFYTTRPRGTGLGLAIARRLVALHGGRITAANAVDGGGGALFSVYLPKELP